MSIEKITSKIIGDAREQAEAILSQSQAERDEILARAKEEAGRILADAEADGRSEKEKLISRRKAVADIDGRKIMLEEKQKLIAGCFDKAVTKIASMEDGPYVDFLARLLAASGETSGELILNEKDAARIGGKLEEAAAKAVPGSRCAVSAETRDIKGGFLLKKGSVYVNCAVEAMVDEAREDLVGDVAARLFE